MEREYGVRTPQPESPHYIVSGGGGAFLHATDFKKDTYHAEEVFPKAEDWSRYARFLSKAANRTRQSKKLIGRIAGWFNQAAQKDADAAQFLSFILVHVTKTSVRVTPACMKSLQELYPDEGPPVRVDDPSQPVDAEALEEVLSRCRSLDLRWR